MGCYDMVVGNFVCPYCDNVERIVLEQTKAGACNFTDYGLGEQAPGFHDDSVESDKRKCGICKREYKYDVTFESGVMKSIKIKDTVFGEVYIYRKEDECVPKIYSEEDLQNMSNRLKWMREVLEFNTQRLKQAEKVVEDINPKIELLKLKISNQVNKKYGLL